MEIGSHFGKSSCAYWTGRCGTGDTLCALFVCIVLLLTTTYAWLAGRHSFVESTVRMDGGMGVIQPQEDYGELCNFTQGWTALAPS